MTRATTLTLALGLALITSLAAAVAAPRLAVAAEDITIGYLQLRKDKRYSRSRTYARYLGQALGRPYSGAKTALGEVKFHAAALDASFKLKRTKGRSVEALIDTVREGVAGGTRFFVVDLAADKLTALAKGTIDAGALLFNVSARETRLRASECFAHVMHVIPSFAMEADALAQFLRSRKWQDVLVLKGPSDGDAQLFEAFERSAKRFGLDIEEVRDFKLGNDPRDRDRNNIDLLTTRAKYDVVFVADTDGEFARNLPYQTSRPRPIVGSEGLSAMAWHWSWERHGAPQLEGRFEDVADRPMAPQDWAAWMAAKAIASGVQRTESREMAPVRDYLLADDTALDGFKGNRLSFRPWNHQLRQPMLLASHTWVVDRAPIEGFLHRKNNLDAIGLDEPDSSCSLS